MIWVGHRQRVVVQLNARNPDVLGTVAYKIADALGKVRGVEPTSIKSGVTPAGNAMEIHIDPGAAALKGMIPAEIKDQVCHYLHNLPIRAQNGNVFSLRSVATTQFVSGQEQPATTACPHHHHSNHARLDECSFCRSLDKGGQTQHHGHDRHGDDHRYRHRDRDLPRFRLSASASVHGATPGAMNGGP